MKIPIENAIPYTTLLPCISHDPMLQKIKNGKKVLLTPS